jgi:hypothetical protein
VKSIVSGLFLAALLGGALSAHATCTPDGCNSCGDGVCQVGEASTCPQDCCGNGVCQAGESTTSCPEYCYCGNGRCDTGENGSSCAKECCDYNTPCTQTQNDAGVNYCRRWSLNNGGLWGGWGWISIASYNSTYCSQQSQVCVVEANCHNTYSICVHTTGATGRFEILPTPSCP